MINMDTEKDYGEAHLNPLQRQNMRIFIEATKSLMDSVGEEGLSIRKIAAKAGYNSATIYNYFQDLDELMLFGSVSFFRDVFQNRLLFTNLLREENYTEEVEEITPVLLNSLYHTFLHEAIKRGKDFDVEQKAAYFVNLVKTILDGSVIISNYQKEHD